jgi:hypothetical protein
VGDAARTRGRGSPGGGVLPEDGPAHRAVSSAGGRRGMNHPLAGGC